MEEDNRESWLNAVTNAPAPAERILSPELKVSAASILTQLATTLKPGDMVILGNLFSQKSL